MNASDGKMETAHYLAWRLGLCTATDSDEADQHGTACNEIAARDRLHAANCNLLLATMETPDQKATR